MDARTDTLSVALVRHRAAEANALTGITVHVERLPGHVAISFVARGKVGSLSLAEPGASRRADDLWQHTCFEAFMEPAFGSGYREFNLSPSNAWAAYAFSGYRRGMTEVEGNPVPRLSVKRSSEVIVVEAMLATAFPDQQSLMMGLSAVEEDLEGRKSYWALAHMEDGPPDFHHPIGFDLELFPLEPV